MDKWAIQRIAPLIQGFVTYLGAFLFRKKDSLFLEPLLCIGQSLCYHLIPVLFEVQRQCYIERCGFLPAGAWRRALLADSILQSLLVIRWWEKKQSGDWVYYMQQCNPLFTVFFKVHGLIICRLFAFKYYKALWWLDHFWAGDVPVGELFLAVTVFGLILSLITWLWKWTKP